MRPSPMAFPAGLVLAALLASCAFPSATGHDPAPDARARPEAGGDREPVADDVASESPSSPDDATVAEEARDGAGEGASEALAGDAGDAGDASGADQVSPEVAVACNGQDCVAGQACCLEERNNYAGECVDRTSCAGVVVSCDGPEDCPSGSVCCSQGLDGTGCEVDCSGDQARPLCHTGVDCQGQGAGAECCPVPGTVYSVCAGSCG